MSRSDLPRPRWHQADAPKAIIFLASILGLCAAGCSLSTWNAKATDGNQQTTWNHGLVIGLTAGGFELYIGPGKGSTTTISNRFEGEAAKKIQDAPPPAPVQPQGGGSVSDTTSRANRPASLANLASNH